MKVRTDMTVHEYGESERDEAMRRAFAIELKDVAAPAMATDEMYSE